MTSTEQVLFSLLRRALFQTEEVFPADADWEAVFSEAKAQAVAGIAYGALPADVPAGVKALWDNQYYALLASNVRYWAAQDELHRLLVKNKIPYVILKGASAAMLYPRPLDRAMGDIDFLVRPEDFDRTRELLLSEGYVQDHEGYERHESFRKGGVSFELHRRFSYDDLDMEQTLRPAITEAVLQTVDGHAFCSFPPAVNGLVLLAHLWNHLHTGVGLRQLLDWCMDVHTTVSDAFWEEEFGPLARRYGLEKLAAVAARLGQEVFGLPEELRWCRDEDEALCGELLQEVLRTGNFGRKKPDQGKTEWRAEGALSGFHRYGFFRHLQKRGEVNWIAYHRHPWLRPFAGVYQAFRYLVLWTVSPKRKKLSSLVREAEHTGDLLEKLRPDGTP